jgi:hypothetical protein
MRTGALERRAGRIDRHHLAILHPGRALAGQRGHGKTPGVAIAIEHAAQAQALHAVGKALAAVALVQVEAGFVALGNVERQAPLVLVDLQLQRRRLAPGGRAAAQPAGAGSSPSSWRTLASERSYRRARPVCLEQRVGNHFFPMLGARAGELRHQRVAIAVHDQAWQTVGLAMHQAHAVALYIKSASGAY